MKKITILLVLIAAVFTSCKKDDNASKASQSDIISYFLAHEWQGSISFYKGGNNNDYYFTDGEDSPSKVNSFSEDSKGNYVATWDGYYGSICTFTVNPKTGDAALLVDGTDPLYYSLTK